jgi:1-deoxy-D-xylulose-5-phosphate reductoisomerase
VTQLTGITVLGSTGSIGVNTLDVVSRYPERFRVVALTANRNVDALAGQCEKFHPDYAVMANETAAEQLQVKLNKTAPEVRVLAGEKGLMDVAVLDASHYVMAAIVGAAGLLPTLRAVEKGKRVLLANKEALVMSGALFMNAVRENNAVLLPIDSEHNAVLQCMPDAYVAGKSPPGVERIMLTASGGPFRTLPLSQLKEVTPEQAVAHPNWEMGRKISVDSATMMNKGLEVIEASWLFSLPLEKIDVVLHPQSILHSLVEYADGSVLAHLGNPDMRIPISHALAWPGRFESGARKLDVFKVGKLEFETPDKQRFPCLGLAYQALENGGTAPAILNAANEVAVSAFLDGLAGFNLIPEIIEQTMSHCPYRDAVSIQVILEDDAVAREIAGDVINARRKTVA